MRPTAFSRAYAWSAPPPSTCASFGDDLQAQATRPASTAELLAHPVDLPRRHPELLGQPGAAQPAGRAADLGERGGPPG